MTKNDTEDTAVERKTKEFIAELNELCEKYGVFTSHMWGSMPHSDAEEYDFNAHPDSRDYALFYIDYYGSMLRKVHDQVHDKVLAEADHTQANVLYDHYSALGEGLTKIIPQMIEQLKSTRTRLLVLAHRLGIDKARCFILKPAIKYHVFTETTKWEISYGWPDENDIPTSEWIVKPLESATDVSPRAEVLYFLGMLQESGEMFGYGDFPIVSTGDKMVFTEDRWNKRPDFVTSKVLNVVESTNVM